jgi:DNA invertase Pin-like site-specific DNA recombinase
MTGKRIGYIRVSTVDQHPDRQLVDVQLDKKFIEFASASTINRPQLQTMMDFVREDDIVFVHSMDRLSRTVKDLKDVVTFLIEKNVKIKFVKEGLEFGRENSSISMLMLHLLGAFAEFEHAFIRERQLEGVSIAKSKGRYKGGHKKLNESKIEVLRKELLTRKSKTQIAKELGICRQSLYGYIERLGVQI